MEPHASLAEWERGRLTSGRDADPVRGPRGAGRVFGLGHETSASSSRPWAGVRSQDVRRSSPSPPRWRRVAGRPVRLVLERDELFLTLGRHRRASRVRLGARAMAPFVGRRVWAQSDTGAYADTAPTSPRRAAGRRSALPLRPRRGRRRLRLHRTAQRRGPLRPRGHAGGVGLRAGRGPAGRAARPGPLDLRLQERAARRRAFATGEVLHDSASRSASRTSRSASAGARTAAARGSAR